MPIEPLHNESSLVRQMQGGSEEAFTLLYRHYSPRLYLNILGMVRDPQLAEEMIQELFTRIWQKRHHSGLAQNFAGYLYRTAQHLVHDFFRRLKRDRKLYEQFKSQLQEDYQHIEEQWQSKESDMLLKEAIEQLPPRQRRAYELVRERGLTYKKAAELMNISPLTVKEYLKYTTRSIRAYLLQHSDTTLIFILLYLLF